MGRNKKAYDVSASAPKSKNSAEDSGEVNVVLGQNNVAYSEKDKNGLPPSYPGTSNHKVKNDTEGSDEKEKEELKTVSVGQLFRYADCVDIMLMLLGTICACCHGAALPGLIIVFGDMTDLFIDNAQGIDNETSLIVANCTMAYGETMENVLQDSELMQEVLTACGRQDILEKLYNTLILGLTEEMGKFALYYVYIAIAVLFVAYGQVAFWLIPSYRQTQKVRTQLFRHIMRQEIGWFDTHEVAELTTRMTEDVNKVQEGIGDKISNFFQWFSTFLAGIIIGFIYGWKLCLVILATSPVLVAAGGYMTYMTTAATKKELAAYAKAGAVAEEVFSSVRTVVAFGGQQKESRRYQDNLDEAKAFGVRKSMVSGIGMGLVFFVIFAVYALAFWYGSKLVREDPHYTAGRMLIVFFCVLIGAFALGNAAPSMSNFAAARGAAYTLWEILDRESEIDSYSATGEVPSAVSGTVNFVNVHFKYPSRPDVPVLQGLNVEVKRGQTVALVGASGCGKSTTIQLLQRFYDPHEGSVQIDGKDLREYNITWLRQHIGVVSQEPVLFDTTIIENIKYGRENVTDQEVEMAAREANAHDFIMKLPKKYETLVGERGAQLSGGQKQRIAIARALVRDPRILLLDEATSALDTESESIVQAALDKVRQGRTTIVIAHRLSTIKNADLIYSLQDGQVYEQGNHSELMAKGESGIYYHLVNNQKMMETETGELFEQKEIHRPDMNRSVSVMSAGKHGRKRGISESHSVEEADTTKDEEKLPDPSLARVMKMNAPEWLFIIIGCVASILNGGVQPAYALIFSEVLGVFALPPDEQEQKALLYSMMFLVVAVVAGLAMFFQAYMFGKSGEELTMRIRSQAFDALLRQEMAYYDDSKNSTGALCTRLATDASAVQGATGVRLGTVCMSFAAIGTGIVIGFVYSWKLTLVILGFMPVVMIAGMIQMKILGGQAGEKQEELESAGKIATQAIENVRTVASLTKEPLFYQQYETLTSGPYNANVKKAHAIGIVFSFTQSITFFAQATAFYFGSWLIENDGLDFVAMFKVFTAIIFGAMAVGQASSFAPDYGKAKLAAARIFALYDRQPAIDSSDPSGEKLASFTGTIEFRGVHFNYPTRPTVAVLRGLDVTVKPKEVLAFVGSSGCGKSTSVSLIERFYDVQEGDVLLDGFNIKSLNIQWLRGQLGIVQQEPILFDTSIKENIAYGDNSRDIPFDEIIQAARDANIHNFIESLPDGYETNVGDKGAQLSGGQKQRVAIARALVRNPKILLLDEATSALDTESEKVVQEALDKAQQGRTTIVIAHRLSTIQNADCITVIHNGKVAEAGTHSELMAQKGFYYKLNFAQQQKRKL